MREQASAALRSISQYPRIDPKRVLRIYKKLGISSMEELRDRLETGEIELQLGLRMAQHVRQGLTETHAMLLYRADDLCAAVEEFLVGACGVRRAELAGDVRRRVEVIEEAAFIVETDDFPGVVARLQRYGGRTPLVVHRALTEADLRIARTVPERAGVLWKFRSAIYRAGITRRIR